MDWTHPQVGPLIYAPAQRAALQGFVLERWCDWAAAREVAPPQDLSGACRYGSLFMLRLFGGSLRGNYQHQYNDIGGLHVDLSADAADVRAMTDPWLHEPLYFDVPEQRAALQACLPRVDRWVQTYLSQTRQSGLLASP